MGSFGVKPLENDDALDWLVRFAQSPLNSVRDALSLKSGTTPSSSRASRAVAVAYLLSGKRLTQKEMRVCIASGIGPEQLIIEADPKLLRQAIATLLDIRADDSELRKEWRERGLESEWLKTIDLIVKSLEQRANKIGSS